METKGYRKAGRESQEWSLYGTVTWTVPKLYFSDTVLILPSSQNLGVARFIRIIMRSPRTRARGGRGQHVDGESKHQSSQPARPPLLALYTYLALSEHVDSSSQYTRRGGREARNTGDRTTQTSDCFALLALHLLG